jgi:uncharacterized RDD family membrane protein YckC
MSVSGGMDEATGEALPGRAGAFVIDFLLAGAASVVVWLVVTGVQLGAIRVLGGFLGVSDEVGLVITGLFQFVKWGGILAVVAGYFAYTTLQDGQTFGKRYTDVTVVDEDGGPPERRAVYVRTAILLATMPILALLSAVLTLWGVPVGLVFVAGWLLVETGAMLLTDEHTRIGDHFAGTRVVPLAAVGDDATATTDEGTDATTDEGADATTDVTE